jgi:hypothetical protein
VPQFVDRAVLPQQSDDSNHAALVSPASVVRQEFNPGPAKFRRSLRLATSIDASKVDAVYRNGLLVLTMPKAEDAKPRQVQVKLTSGDNK